MDDKGRRFTATIGIDPGKNGGISYVYGTEPVSFAWKMPESDREVFCLLSDISKGVVCGAVIEAVWSSPQMGVASAFTFGRGVGALHMALAALRIPFLEVRPQVWQKDLGCLTGGDKNITKALATQLFPTVKVTHSVADALLIAEWGRRHHGISRRK